MKHKLILLLVTALIGLSCRDDGSPIVPQGKYRVHLLARGSELMASNTADTLIAEVRGVRDTLTSVRLPWMEEVRLNTGDSVALRAWDSRLDTWADSGNGFAEFIEVQVFSDTTVVSCSSEYRNYPNNGEWMHTTLAVPTDSAVRRILSYPPELRPNCDPLH